MGEIGNECVKCDVGLREKVGIEEGEWCVEWCAGKRGGLDSEWVVLWWMRRVMGWDGMNRWMW